MSTSAATKPRKRGVTALGGGGKPPVAVVVSSDSRNKKSFWETLFPISENFYEGNKDEDLVAPRDKIVPFVSVLRVIQAVNFAGLLLYYSMPVSFVRQTTIQADYDYGTPTYNCTPMLKNTYWSVRLTHAACQRLSRPPSEETIETTSDGDWVYRPFDFLQRHVGVPEETFAQGAYETTDIAENAKRDFIARLKTLNRCGTDGGFEEASRSDSKTWRISPSGGYRWIDNPSGTPGRSAIHANICRVYNCASSCGPGETWSPTDHECSADSCQRASSAVDTSTACSGHNGVYQDWDTFCELENDDDHRDLFNPRSCYYNHSHPLMRDVFVFMGLPADSTSLPSSLSSSAGRALDGYHRDKVFETCEITRQEAMRMYEAFYEADVQCAWTKASPPYECEGYLPRPPLERMSLAYSNSLLFYTVFSSIAVSVFFKAASSSSSSSSSNGERRVPVVTSAVDATPNVNDDENNNANSV